MATVLALASRAHAAAALRAACRSECFDAPTAGEAPGFVQANLVVVPRGAADAFADFCAHNRGPCPLLERLRSGDPVPRRSAPGADLRTDVPRYNVHRAGQSPTCVRDIRDFWSADAVAFLLGCSFSFDEALSEAGLPPRNVLERKNVSMYRTKRSTVGSGPFHGPLVVSMRPYPAQRVEHVGALTRPFTFAHGAPVHEGDPAQLGIEDLARPQWGDPVSVNPDEVPIFWACGVTAQVAVEAAVARREVAWAITHAPGHMFVTDLRSRDLL